VCSALREENEDDMFTSPQPVAKKPANRAKNTRQTRATSQPIATRQNLDSVLSAVDSSCNTGDANV
jgi:hypothetical protein